MMRFQAVGGQLLEAEVNGRSLFYISPLSVSGKTARGGLPVCFPQFNMLGNLPKHGYARHEEWRLAFSGPNEVGYELCIEPNTWPAWPYKAKVSISYQCTKSGISVCFKVFNLGDIPFPFTAGLHPYFKLNNLLEASVIGLEGSSCLNVYDAEQTRFENEKLVFDQRPFETCFRGTPSLVLSEYGKSKLQLESTGFTHWMIWNPGEHGALTLNDLPDEDWQQFICIEPILGEQTILNPGEAFTGTLEITTEE